MSLPVRRRLTIKQPPLDSKRRLTGKQACPTGYRSATCVRAVFSPVAPVGLAERERAGRGSHPCVPHLRSVDSQSPASLKSTK